MSNERTSVLGNVFYDVPRDYTRDDMMNILPSTCDDPLMDHLPIDDVQRLGAVSKSVRERVASYMARRFRLARVLCPFMDEKQVESFRALMERYQMVISGSIALQFLSRTVWTGTDLDLFVGMKEAPHIVEWLQQAGYVLTLIGNEEATAVQLDLATRLEPEDESAELPDPQPTFEPAIVGGYIGTRMVYTFVHKDTRAKVQIVRCPGTPIQTILKFHSTAVVNVLTHNIAYCVYPRATLLRKISLYQPFASATYELQVALQKYEERGWTILPHPSIEDGYGSSALFPFGPRHLGDSQTLKIVVHPPYASNTLIENNSWTVSYDGNMFLDISATIVKSKRLAFTYMVPNDKSRAALMKIWVNIASKNKTNRFFDAEMKAFLTEHST